jgi:hypothetical protein
VKRAPRVRHTFLDIRKEQNSWNNTYVKALNDNPTLLLQLNSLINKTWLDLPFQTFEPTQSLVLGKLP